MIRNIPCLYYREEIEFMKGAPQDTAGNHDTLDMTGRAYFGDYLAEGKITNSAGNLSFNVKGKSAGIYVLNGPGKIGVDGVYLR